MSHTLFNPNVRLLWAAGCAVLLAAFVAGDWTVHAQGRGSALAPTAGDLWLAIGLGGLVGVVGCVGERFLLTRRRADQLAFHRAPLLERMAWRLQWRNLRQTGLWLLLLFALIGWCAWFRVFVLPPLLAMNAVMFACNRRLVAGFRVELASSQEAELPYGRTDSTDR